MIWCLKANNDQVITTFHTNDSALYLIISSRLTTYVVLLDFMMLLVTFMLENGPQVIIGVFMETVKKKWGCRELQTLRE